MIKKISAIFGLVASLFILAAPAAQSQTNITAPVVFSSGTGLVPFNVTANTLTTAITLPASTNSGTFILSSARICIVNSNTVTNQPQVVIQTGNSTATLTLNLLGQPAISDAFTVAGTSGTTTYTFQSGTALSGTTAGHGYIAIGTNLAGTLTNIVGALNNSGSSAGNYGSPGTFNISGSANTSNSVLLSATTSGTAGNALTATGSFAAPSVDFLSGGTFSGGYTGGVALTGTITISGTGPQQVTLGTAVAPTPFVITGGSAAIPIQVKAINTGTATTLNGKLILEGIELQ